MTIDSLPDDHIADPKLTPQQKKVQRWVDIVASLLARRYPISFKELSKEVPAYMEYDGDSSRYEAEPEVKKKDVAVKRGFERDKDELKAFGVHIESVSGQGAADFLYRLRTTEFYLPYLAFTSPRGVDHPERVNHHYYQSLATLAFDPDELLAVAHAAARARALGDPLLATEVDMAMRKLAFDLPLDAAAPDPTTSLAAPRAIADPATLATLGEALAIRRPVSFSYRTMGTDTVATREVEPYGLSFVGGHWYLVGRDLEKAAIRNFRVSRIAKPKMTGEPDDVPLYEIPKEFSLREHARSRHAWELGDGDATIVEVDFAGVSGAARAAAELGTPVAGDPSRRSFRVRRLDAFARWLLSFAGEARPVGPEALIIEVRRIANETLGVYQAITTEGAA